MLNDWRMRSSMSRKGDCRDNAPIESLWGSLKRACVHGHRFATRQAALEAVMDYRVLQPSSTAFDAGLPQPYAVRATLAGGTANCRLTPGVMHSELQGHGHHCSMSLLPSLNSPRQLAVRAVAMIVSRKTKRRKRSTNHVLEQSAVT